MLYRSDARIDDGLGRIPQEPQKYSVMDLLERVLSAEAYWREALKNAVFVIEDYCPFCETESMNHKPDCPWLLAQETP